MSGGTATPAGAGDAQPPVPREGVSLAALRAFAAEHAAKSFAAHADAAGGAVMLSFKELTTTQVVELIIKPATLTSPPPGAAKQGPHTYAKLLQARVRTPRSLRTCCFARTAGDATRAQSPAALDPRGRPHVATATCFVSHAWQYSFAKLLAALEAHADTTPGAEDAYFWLGAPRRADTACACAHRAGFVPRYVRLQPAQAGWAEARVVERRVQDSGG